MKIAVSTESGHVSAHFGRCPVYTLVEVEAGRVAARREIPNPGHQPDFLPGYLSELGVSVIIAGGMGPRAQELFAEKNIKTFIGVQGRVDEVIDKFLRGELEAGRDLCDRGRGRDDHCRQGGDSAEARPAGPVRGKILVSAKEPSLDAEVDPNFGRAAFLLVVDLENLEFQQLDRAQSEAGHGAGIQSARLAVDHGVSAVLTGHVGPNALGVLGAAGIMVKNAENRTVREAVTELSGRRS